MSSFLHRLFLVLSLAIRGDGSAIMPTIDRLSSDSIFWSLVAGPQTKQDRKAQQVVGLKAKINWPSQCFRVLALCSFQTSPRQPESSVHLQNRGDFLHSSVLRILKCFCRPSRA